MGISPFNLPVPQVSVPVRFPVLLHLCVGVLEEEHRLCEQGSIRYAFESLQKSVSCSILIGGVLKIFVEIVTMKKLFFSLTKMHLLFNSMNSLEKSPVFSHLH